MSHKNTSMKPMEKNPLTSNPQQQNQARLDLAERFLLEIILPKLEEKDNSSEMTSEELSELLYQFQQNNPGLGEDFDLANVWTKAWEQTLLNECLAETDPENLPDNAAEIEVAEFLLSQAVFGPRSRGAEGDYPNRDDLEI